MIIDKPERLSSRKAVDDDRRQPLGRLVEQQEARVEDQRAADGEHLLLPAGQLLIKIDGIWKITNKTATHSSRA